MALFAERAGRQDADDRRRAGIFALASMTMIAFALILMLSAPSVTGSPNITALMGHAPEPAFRLLILGTALMPLTVIPVFLLAPGLGGLGDVLRAAGRFIGVIGITVVCAFLLRRLTLPQLREVLVVIILLRAIWDFKEFDMIFLLTGGGLALANELKQEHGKRIFLDMKLFENAGAFGMSNYTDPMAPITEMTRLCINL